MFFSHLVEPFLQSKQLRTVPEGFEPPPRPINVVYPHARLLPMRTWMFIKWIKKELRDFQSSKERMNADF